MQSPLQEPLQAIQPGLTLYGVLITFAVVAFAIFRHFWRYERELGNENLERLRDLLTGFRVRYIEPKINAQLDNAIEGLESAVDIVVADLYRSSTTPAATDEGARLESDQTQSDRVSEIVLRERLFSELKNTRRAARQFLPSDSGQKLLDDLDRMFDQKSKLARHYTLARRACAQTSYACLSFSLLALAGILRVLGAWPDLIEFFWLFLLLQTLSFALYSFIRLEFHRRALFSMWEDFQFYGKI
jgi:hypothetical protein